MKKHVILCLLAVLVLALCSTALAAELTVSAGSTSVSHGDEVTVTLTVKGEDIAAATGTFTYDSSVLTFVSGSGAGDGTISLLSLEQGGAPSLTAIIKFAVTGDGEAVVRATIASALDYAGNELGGAEAAVSISASGTPPPDGEDAGPAVDHSLTGVPAQNVEGAAEQMYIWRDLSSLTLPSSYADSQLEYHGEFVGSARIPDTEEPTLLYLSTASGDDAGYYIYDDARDMLYPYVTVSSVSASYALIRPQDGVQPPEGYFESPITISEREFPAWQNDPDSGVYLLYVRNSAGEYGFYLYNQEDSSVQRFTAFVVPEPEPTPTPAPEPEQQGTISINKPLLIGVGAAAGVAIAGLTAAVVAYAVANARRRKRAAARRAARERAQSGQSPKQ